MTELLWRDYVKNTRSNLNLTQIEFARLLGVSHSLVQRWEYGTSIPDSLQAEIIYKFNQQISEGFVNPNVGNVVKKALIVGGVIAGLACLLNLLNKSNQGEE